MRHTYADTSLARADLGFAPTVGLEEGLAAEYAWLSWSTVHERSARIDSALRRSLARGVLVGAPACAQPTRGAVPPGTAEPDKFLFDKGTEALEREEVAHGARVLQAGHRNLHAEPVSARRQARHRRHLSRTKARRSAGAGDQRVPGVPVVLPDESAAPTTRSTSSAMAHFRQMRAPQRDQTETRDAIKEFETFVERYPNSTLMPEVQGASCARRGIA